MCLNVAGCVRRGKQRKSWSGPVDEYNHECVWPQPQQCCGLHNVENGRVESRCTVYSGYIKCLIVNGFNTCNFLLNKPLPCKTSSVACRLVEDTYTLDEITEMLDGLCAVVRGEVESELINTAHTNTLLLRQLFCQSEKWHLKLQADISELENRYTCSV